MKDADQQLLDGLGMVTDLPQDQWALVVADVEKAGGVRAVSGQARVEIERAVEKARTLVQKHPGHADQSVHGGGKGKGGKAPAPASESQPRKPAYGTSPVNDRNEDGWSRSASGNLIKDSDKALADVTESLAAIKRNMSIGHTGETRRLALSDLDKAKSSLDKAKRNIDLAAKMNGLDRGTVQVNMRAVRDHSNRARKEVQNAFKVTRREGSPLLAKFDEALAMLDMFVGEGTDGGVF
jgi:hypothetical protein